MPTFAGIDHLSLTVTDLDRSQRFYTSVLDFLPVLDFGYGRVCIHRATSFTLSLVRHDDATGLPFTERNTGIDHIGLTVADRDELVEWERKLDAAGVTYTPIRDMDLGHHLNFRDPDGIPLELYCPNAPMADVLDALRVREPTREEILAFIHRHLGASDGLTVPQGRIEASR